MPLSHDEMAASLSRAISATIPLLSSGVSWSEQDWVTQLSYALRHDPILSARQIIPFAEFRMNFRVERKGNQHADLSLWDRTAMRLIALIEVKHSRAMAWNLSRLDAEVDGDHRKILEESDCTEMFGDRPPVIIVLGWSSSLRKLSMRTDGVAIDASLPPQVLPQGEQAWSPQILLSALTGNCAPDDRVTHMHRGSQFGYLRGQGSEANSIDHVAAYLRRTCAGIACHREVGLADGGRGKYDLVVSEDAYYAKSQLCVPRQLQPLFSTHRPREFSMNHGEAQPNLFGEVKAAPTSSRQLDLHSEI